MAYIQTDTELGDFGWNPFSKITNWAREKARKQAEWAKAHRSGIEKAGLTAGLLNPVTAPLVVTGSMARRNTGHVGHLVSSGGTSSRSSIGYKGHLYPARGTSMISNGHAGHVGHLVSTRRHSGFHLPNKWGKTNSYRIQSSKEYKNGKLINEAEKHANGLTKSRELVNTKHANDRAMFYNALKNMYGGNIASKWARGFVFPLPTNSKLKYVKVPTAYLGALLRQLRYLRAKYVQRTAHDNISKIKIALGKKKGQKVKTIYASGSPTEIGNKIIAGRASGIKTIVVTPDSKDGTVYKIPSSLKFDKVIVKLPDGKVLARYNTDSLIASGALKIKQPESKKVARAIPISSLKSHKRMTI